MNNCGICTVKTCFLLLLYYRSRNILDDFREAYYWLRQNTDENARYKLRKFFCVMFLFLKVFRGSFKPCKPLVIYLFIHLFIYFVFIYFLYLFIFHSLFFLFFHLLIFHLLSVLFIDLLIY